ncbi:C40 family peptidase [Kribbella sp. NPDC055071]
MSKLLQIGISFADELSDGIGHVACTLAGVNYECRGGKGCLKGSAARGAANGLFKHHYYRLLNDMQAKRGKDYADACNGQPYVWGGMPTHHMGGDCSGFMSGIICAATGVDPQKRLFATGNWLNVFKDLGFKEGLTPPAGLTIDVSNLLDDIKAGHKTAQIVAIQKALNRQVGSHLAGVGIYGPDTKLAMSAWQHKLNLKGDVGHPGTDADGLPGPFSLQKLGFRTVD